MAASAIDSGNILENIINNISRRDDIIIHNMDIYDDDHNIHINRK